MFDRIDNLGKYAISTPVEERFWVKVDKNSPIPPHCPELGNCWVWTANMTRAGYGRIFREKRNVATHRLVWEFTKGLIPHGMLVLHKCDNPSCVRIDHLFLGTVKNNSEDMVRKGRQITWDKIKHRRSYTGEKHPRAKFTNEQIIDIRKEYKKGSESYKTLSQRYGVSKGTIAFIIQRRNWKDV